MQSLFFLSFLLFFTVRIAPEVEFLGEGASWSFSLASSLNCLPSASSTPYSPHLDPAPSSPPLIQLQLTSPSRVFSPFTEPMPLFPGLTSFPCRVFLPCSALLCRLCTPALPLLPSLRRKANLGLSKQMRGVWHHLKSHK